ncbi:MAG: YbhB/YbcL family Raf kinase inhibitor-like protein, partial [Patescibacteria group bacterium]|nr:YbhB/YbcL family Raf kinase inhibitor-like protein [Patescibacteria group bacterium]
MILTGLAFDHSELIPSKYTCDGENINPHFQISETPKGAKSLVLIVDDPDAPGRIFVHWVVWNINPTTIEIQENSVPKVAVEGMTDFGKTGYGGPCPPS